jgi:type IV pilus assembly protein PilA
MATKIRLKIGVVLAAATCVLIALFIAIDQGCACSPEANESSAVASLRELYSANMAYADHHPEHGYPKTLNELSSRSYESEQHNESEVFIEPLFAVGVKSGYKFAYRPRSSKGSGKFDTYEVYASPTRPGKSGRRYFFMSEAGIIHVSETGAANASDSVPH